MLLGAVGIASTEEFKPAFFEECTAHQQPILAFSGFCLQESNLILLTSSHNAGYGGVCCCAFARVRMSQIQQPL